MTNIIIQPPGISKITDLIWIGSAEDAKKATKDDFDAILNVADWLDYSTCPHVIYVKIPMKEDGQVPCLDIQRAIRCLDTWVKAGFRILVHCHCGISRSPMIVAAYIARASSFQGNMITVAMDLVKSKRDISFTAQTPFIENVKRCL